MIVSKKPTKPKKSASRRPTRRNQTTRAKRTKPVIKPADPKRGVYIKRSVANYLADDTPPKLSWWQRWLERITGPPSPARQQKQLAKVEKKAQKLARLPASRWRRWLWRLRPDRLLRAWFSWQGLKVTLKVLVICFLLGTIGTLGLFSYYGRDLPNITALSDCVQGQTTRYYDRTGQVVLWASKSDIQCQPVKLDEVSDNLIKAVIASEDQDFYEHSGVHLMSILRAASNNLVGNDLQGGSTITQQYIKNAVLKDRDRTIERKVRETISALALERKFTKDEILAAYLNTISFGSVYDGIEAASLGYFNKPSAELTVAEASLLASAIPAPGYYWSAPEAHLARHKEVLALMRQQGQVIERQSQADDLNDNDHQLAMTRGGGISQAEYEAALEVDIMNQIRRSYNQYDDIIAPHFVLEVEKRLRQEFGEDVRLKGYQVITTIDLEVQTILEAAIKAGEAELLARDFDNAAGVVVEADSGQVLALIGSRGFDIPGYGQTNTATAARDPGSVFKIFDYGALIDGSSNWGAGSILYDYETVFTPPPDSFTPTNYSKTTQGPVTVRQALGLSLNIPATKAMYLAGANQADRNGQTVRDFAARAGLETPPVCGGGYCGLSGAFGGGLEIRLDETVNAYASFARGGLYTPLTYVDRIYDGQGTLLRQWPANPQRVFKAETAYILNDILSDPGARYTNQYNVTGLNHVALKTGTDDFYKNNSIVGYTREVAFGLWFGNHDISRDFHGEPNTVVPKSIIWKSFMANYHRQLDKETRPWPRPTGLQTFDTNHKTGWQVLADDNDVTEAETETETDPDLVSDIFPSWFEPEEAPTNRVQIDRLSRHLITECTPPLAILEVRLRSVKAELPQTDPFYREWMKPVNENLETLVGDQGVIEDNDQLHQCDDRPPALEFLVDNPFICQNICRINLRPRAGTWPVSTIKVQVGGEVIDEFDVSGQDGQPVTYTYIPRLDHQTLRFSLIDQALYESQEASLTLISSNQTAPVLNPVTVAADGSYIQVTWQPARPNLKLEFSGDCLPNSQLELPASQTSRIIRTSDLRGGQCRIRILDGHLRSGYQTFSLPGSIL